MFRSTCSSDRQSELMLPTKQSVKENNLIELPVKWGAEGVQNFVTYALLAFLGHLKEVTIGCWKHLRDLADGDRGIGRELDCPGSGVDFGSSRFNSLHCYLRVNCPPPHPMCWYWEARRLFRLCESVFFFAVSVHSVEDGQGFLSFRNLKTVITCLYSYDVLGLGWDAEERNHHQFCCMKLSSYNNFQKNVVNFSEDS